MPLNEGDRKTAAREFIRFAFEQLNQTANKPSDVIKAALDASDDWCDANAASYNTALPVAFRNNATVAEKNILLAINCMKRAGIF